MAGKRAGIHMSPMQAGGIAGLDELLAKLNNLPATTAVGVQIGVTSAARNIQARAQLNCAAGSGISPQQIDVDVQPQGAVTRAAVFVAATGGKILEGEWALDWPTFVEMGTGPMGIASGGDKYPLPSSAYTQKPWIYKGADGRFHRTSGRAAAPYLWPAYKAEEPYILEHIEDGIRTVTGGGG